jgi:hypothetical protein
MKRRTCNRRVTAKQFAEWFWVLSQREARRKLIEYQEAGLGCEIPPKRAHTNELVDRADGLVSRIGSIFLGYIEQSEIFSFSESQLG